MFSSVSVSVSVSASAASVPTYCFCHRPESYGNMIQCSACSEWFHQSCMALTEAQASAMPWWNCPVCVGKGKPVAPVPAVAENHEDWMEEHKLAPEYTTFLDKRIAELQDMIDILESIPIARTKVSSSSSFATPGPASLKRKSSAIESTSSALSSATCAICNTKRRSQTLQCVNCSCHFHIDCAGIDSEQAQFIRTYRCDSCIHNPDISRSLTYCVCSGYDDGRKMIQCEKCTEWYHTECLQIDPPAEDEEWICTTCIEMGAESQSAAGGGVKKKKGKFNHSKLLLNAQPRFCFCHANLHDPRTMIRCSAQDCEKRFYHYQCAKVNEFQLSQAEKESWVCLLCTIRREEAELIAEKAELEEFKAELMRRNGGFLPASFATPNALLCICREVYDPLRPMVICSTCLMEYHYPCVQRDPQDCTPFSCPRCVKKSLKAEIKE